MRGSDLVVIAHGRARGSEQRPKLRCVGGAECLDRSEHAGILRDDVTRATRRYGRQVVDAAHLSPPPGQSRQTQIVERQMEQDAQRPDETHFERGARRHAGAMGMDDSMFRSKPLTGRS